MSSLVSLSRARKALHRWLVSIDEPSAEPRQPVGKPVLPQPEAGIEGRVRAFMDEVKANSQDWVGRVRLINFDDVKERMGAAWPKLQGKVELLAEKVIAETLSDRDLFLNMGGAEFLVFIADVSPEEVRIRCLAIVEVIHKKLFGVNDEIREGSSRFAECHVAQTGGADLELARSGATNQSPSEVVRRLFRPDAELLEGDEIAASAQAVIDAIILRASESADIADLGHSLKRLRHLSRDLALLESPLAARSHGRGQPLEEKHGTPGLKIVEAREAGSTSPFKIAREDIGELVSVLDVGPGHAHPDFLAALEKLRTARARRATSSRSGEMAAVQGFPDGLPGVFEYVPVCRFVAQGEQIYKGIYRVTCKGNAPPIQREPENGSGGCRHPNAAAMERFFLQHALQYWDNNKSASRFMLMVCVHVETLHGPNSLRQYSTILRAAQLAAKRRLIIEIVGYRERDNTIAIRRAIEELRVHCHALFVTVSDDFGNLQQVASECKKVGVHAFGVDVTNSEASRPELLDVLRSLDMSGARHSMPTYVDGISDLSVLARAIAGRIDYICAPTLIPSRPKPEDVERMTLNDLFTAI